MKKLLVVAAFIFSINALGMEKQQTPDAALLGQACLANLPPELKIKIIGHLSTTEGYYTEKADSVLNLRKTSKQFYSIIDNDKVTEMIIELLMRDPNFYSEYKKIYGAMRLLTPTAYRYLQQFKNDSKMQEALNETFESHLSDMYRHDEELLFLLRAGVNPNAIVDRMTLLERATAYSNGHVRKLLIAFGAQK